MCILLPTESLISIDVYGQPPPVGADRLAAYDTHYTFLACDDCTIVITELGEYFKWQININ